MNKIALLFLVTSLSMATTPIWAGNGVIPPSKPNITLNKNTNGLNDNPQKEENGSWFTKKNVGIAVVVLLIAAGLINKLGNDNKSSKTKK